MSQGQTILRMGEFVHRVTLQRPVYNSPRDEIIDWEDVATVWAAIQQGVLPLTGNRSEKEEADREIAISDTQIQIRYYAGIDTTWRAKHGSVTYDIRNVLDVLEMRVVMYLTCRVVS